MKKGDWLFALFVSSLGMTCLIISATSFRDVTTLRFENMIRDFCFLMLLLSVIIGIVYYFVKKMHKF